MTIAAAAANETAQRVKVTGEATEQLSASINNIGGEAIQGLEMTKKQPLEIHSARNKPFCRLNNTAERIGAI